MKPKPPFISKEQLLKSRQEDKNLKDGERNTPLWTIDQLNEHLNKSEGDELKEIQLKRERLKLLKEEMQMERFKHGQTIPKVTLVASRPEPSAKLICAIFVILYTTFQLLINK